MHRALLLDEIVSRVVWMVRECSDEDLCYSLDVRADLCALALVSCHFSSFALDNLWAAPSVWGLAKTMDDSLWKIEIIETESPYEDNGNQVFVSRDGAFSD
jgi:hypothetical protein